MPEALQVTIIGAGIAGLAAARVLREHHDVTIIEKCSGGHEAGAALNLGPTAVRILEDLGLDRRRCKAVKAIASRSFDKCGRQLHYQDMSQFAVNTEADWLMMHRADLWQDLLRLATADSEVLGIDGEPAEIIWSASIVGINVESGNVRLADGTLITSDLIIGADGIKSILRPLVVGAAAFRTARPSGSSAFRFMLPAEQVRETHGDVDVLDASRLVTFDVHLAHDNTNRSVVLYPCRDMRLINLICIAPDSIIGKQTTESWTADGDRTDLLRCFGDFGPYIRTLLTQAEDVKIWQLRDQDPLPTYTKGRAVLIGDAAHPMTAHQGQGATQSIEDAEGFVLFNDPSVRRDAIPDILRSFDRVRRKRASRVQNITREMHERMTTAQIFKYNTYNRTYPGVRECLRRLAAGEEMITI